MVSSALVWPLFDAVDAMRLVVPAIAGALDEVAFDTERMREAVSAAIKPSGQGYEAERSIDIQASPESVYDLWSRYENFPHFMSHVIEVRDLGLEATGGFETVAFCEIEPYPRAVLAERFPACATATTARWTSWGGAVRSRAGGSTRSSPITWR